MNNVAGQGEAKVTGTQQDGDRHTHRQAGSWSSLLSEPQQVPDLPAPQFPHLNQECTRSFRGFSHGEGDTGWEGGEGSDPPARQSSSGYRAGAHTARS